MIGEPDFGKDQAAVSITLRGGRVLSADVPHARGTAARPVDDEALGEKFISLAEPALGSQQAARLLKRAWVLDTATEVRALLRLTRPAGDGGGDPAR